jgi:hypothetical protein
MQAVGIACASAYQITGWLAKGMVVSPSGARCATSRIRPRVPTVQQDESPFERLLSNWVRHSFTRLSFRYFTNLRDL